MFEEHDEEVEEAEAAESSVREDKDQDIKPFHQKQKWVNVVAVRHTPSRCNLYLT